MAEIVEKEVNVSAADVTLVTDAETVIVSATVRIPSASARVLVKAWALLTTGASTTAVVARIRDGNTASGTLRSTEDTQPVKVTAGGTEPFSTQALVEVRNADSYQACLTLTQTGASANGTVVHSAIELEVLGG